MPTPEQNTFLLRWRGRQMGPYSLAQLNQQLDDHEIGLGHEICYGDKWITLEEFFAAAKAAAAAIASPPPAPKPPAFITLASASPNPPGPGPARLPSTEYDSKTVADPAPGSPPIIAESGPSARTPIIAAPVVLKRPESPPAPPAPPRHRLVYAFLGICFGFLGVHNYYARHWLTGLLQLLLSVATFLLGFGVIAPWLWAMAEALLVRKDGNGVEMI